MKPSQFMIAALLGAASLAQADEQTVTVHAISADGVGSAIGTVRLADSDAGLRLEPDLGGLTPGQHGFHVHQNPSCDAAEKDGKMTAGLAAGGHYDPHHAGRHAGPEGHGHHGDLPALEVGADGRATQPLTVARLKLADIKGRALMIHAGGDNYSDEPLPLGGGGARVACGIIE